MHVPHPAARLFLATILTLGGSWLVMPRGCSQDPPPPDAAAVLKELDQVESGNNSTLQSRRSSALSQLAAAADSGSSAVDFQLRALEATRPKDNQKDLQLWSQQNQQLLGSPQYQNAALFQLRYLILALQRTDQHDAYAQIPEYLAYVNALTAEPSLNPVPVTRSQDDSVVANTTPVKMAPAGKLKKLKVVTPVDFRTSPDVARLLRQPLQKSPVVIWLNIGDLLPDGEDFEAAAGNYKGILEKNVRVPMRTKSDPRVAAVWDTQIGIETAAATAAQNEQMAEDFNKVKLPDLLFRKAQDTAVIGMPNRALQQTMFLIRNYPSHPFLGDWVDYTRGLLTNPSPTPAGNTAKAIASPSPVSLQKPTPGTAGAVK